MLGLAFGDSIGISIHAPREGGDSEVHPGQNKKRHFNPRPPRGGRRNTGIDTALTYGFQSTPPARGATNMCPKLRDSISISIHAPREGGDFPAGLVLGNNYISIHAPREGGDDG